MADALARDRAQAVKELRALLREVDAAPKLADVLRLAEQLQHKAFDVKDWAYRNAMGSETRWSEYAQVDTDDDECED